MEEKNEFDATASKLVPASESEDTTSFAPIAQPATQIGQYKLLHVRFDHLKEKTDA